MARTKRRNLSARPPMLVLRTLHNTDLELRERMAVEAFARGFATVDHYNTLLDMQGLMLLAGSSDPSRKYARDYADKVIGPVLVSIKERYERTGKLGCAATELNTLKAFVEKSKQFWLRQPAELYKLAADRLQEFYDGLVKPAPDGALADEEPLPLAWETD